MDVSAAAIMAHNINQRVQYGLSRPKRKALA